MGCPIETIRRETGAYCAEPMEMVAAVKKEPAKADAAVKEAAVKEANVRSDFSKILSGGYATIPLGHMSEE